MTEIMPLKPTPMPVLTENIPEELKALDRWVLWRWEWNGKKWDKPPLQRNGTRAKSNDPQTWCPFADAMTAYQSGNFDGIGFVLGEHSRSRYIGIDLDHHVVDGELDDDARFVAETVQSYGEFSPSGNGIKIIARGVTIDGTKNDNEKGYEFYDGGRYFTVTGNRLNNSPAEIRDCAIDVQFVHDALIPHELNGEVNTYGGDNSELAKAALKGLRKSRADGYHDWINVGMALHSVSAELLPEWEQWSRQSDKFVEGECAKKWNSFSSGRGITLGTLVYMARQDGWLPAEQNSPSPDTNGKPKKYRRTDYANAERFRDQHRDNIRYCKLWKKWLVWDGHRWAVDETGVPVQFAKQTVRSIYHEAWQIDNPDDREKIGKHAAASEAASRIDAMLKLAQDELPIRPNDLDTDPWLLNCPNGTVDLRTGEMQSHCRDDYITKLCPTPFHPDATSPTWARFLESVFDADAELVRFLQRLFGYSLTGDVREQILPIFWGVGANGKTTLLNAFTEAVGPDYAMKAPPDLLLNKRNETHPTERADLFGKRFVACVESGDGRGLNESLVKELTGSDRIRARKMREDFWEFDPTHKVVLCTNHKPVVRGTDHAIWRRLRLVPFTVVFSGDSQDKSLPQKLLAERQGILAWAVHGCLDWQQNGLAEPKAVESATADYRTDQDVVGQFLADCCVVHPNANVKASDIYKEYKTWCERTGEYPVPQRKFGGALTEKAFERYINDGTWYRGVGLLHGTNGTNGT